MIGLFFGDTDFPKLILKRLKKTKKKYLILDLSKKNIFKKDTKSFRVNIGQFGSILKLLRENKCNKVIFAGKIDKPNLSKLKLDMTGIYYLPRIIKAYKKGDAAILKELINILAFSYAFCKISALITIPGPPPKGLSSILLVCVENFFKSTVFNSQIFFCLALAKIDTSREPGKTSGKAVIIFILNI